MNALDIVQSKGILHSDISPDNIFITESGESILLDFGASKSVFSVHAMDSLQSNVVKRGYSPLEQYGRGRNDKMNPSSDVYSMGATFYRILTGETPPPALERLDKKIPPPSAKGADVSKYADKAILRALNVVPSGRYNSMFAFKKALEKKFSVFDYIGYILMLFGFGLLYSAFEIWRRLNH
jgi:serine/threonine protein kinase